ncbi:conserved hypothetical protein [Vibrio chagasii]|uniref:2'-5' RNA ligase family protein n=1 Tax=Vibrio chagasii TaxID=170679 RepID=UPI00337AF217|nr:conserved hypothetical protein [Vibrio chagasii]
MSKEIYDKMWQRFKVASETDQYELDAHLLDLPNDTRRGITALAYLKQGNSALLDEIMRFQEAVHILEPDQYYHPREELHLTILSIISCVANFEITQVNAQSYIEVFNKVVGSIAPIEIEYKGISASENCIILQGFTVGNGLEQFRNKLREALVEEGLRVTFDSRYKQVTAHSSLIRFKSPINNAQRLFNLCEQYRNHTFGRITLNDFELVFNNWYQHLDITQSLSRTCISLNINTKSLAEA